jgi:hypothetical protein
MIGSKGQTKLDPKDNAKFTLVLLEPKHADECLSDASWARQPKSLGQKAYRSRIDPA